MLPARFNLGMIHPLLHTLKGYPIEKKTPVSPLKRPWSVFHAFFPHLGLGNPLLKWLSSTVAGVGYADLAIITVKMYLADHHNDHG